MALSMRQKQAVTREKAKKYTRASKKEKGKILDDLIDLTGYNRSYAATVLRQAAITKKKTVRCGKTTVTLVEDGRMKRKKRARKRPRKYDKDVLKPLKKIWDIFDCICGKRLAPYLPEAIPVLERFKEIELDDEVREKLLEISAATIDRLLALVKKQYQIKARSNTKPGSLLKHQVPVRTFSEWDEKKPGFVEIDLVSHEGGNASGDFMHTLDVTDVYTQWTETRAVKNKAQVWVFEALMVIQERLPFKLLGIDSDSGSEFINAHLIKYCEENEVTFTRGRPYRKNDSCFVEQKNYSVVRRTVGYARHDTEEELVLLNELYDYLRLYTNFFLPVMKLTEKTRVGSKVTKKYDTARTPYRRVLDFLGKKEQAALTKQYESLNPAELKRQISRLQNKLWKIVHQKRGRSQPENTPALEYIST